MGFWKSWFSVPEAVAETKTTLIEEHAAEAVGSSSPASERIIFSSERDIDLYELEDFVMLLAGHVALT